MNPARFNVFDCANAARLCAASAATYQEMRGSEAIFARSTDTRVCFTRDETDMVIAFRGTADARDWLTDLECAWDIEDGCRVHRGFARALDSAQARVSGEIISALGDGLRVWLTGHSLGGALAMLCAWRFFMAHHQAPFAGLYTFGQPRVGDGAFRASYNTNPELFGATFRIVHANDVVPRIPWLLGNYRHAGREVFFPGAPGIGSDGDWILDPGLPWKLARDARNAWRELRRGKMALLADHHVNTYLALFRDRSASNAAVLPPARDWRGDEDVSAEISETGKGLPS
jgi:hypothetical protein